MCAFANRTAKLPQHVGAMSWHQAKFHYFHACFGFTGIKKLSFSMFPAQPRRPEFWISFPFLAWNLEIYPRTYMWFFNQLWCTGTCACISNLNYAHKGDTFPPRTTSLLERSSDLQEAYTKICSYSANFFYHGMVLPWHDTMPSFMILNQVSQCSRPSHDAQMFEFYSHFLHGTYSLLPSI